MSTPFKGGQKNLIPLPFWMRGIESSLLYPALISFGLTAMKACSPLLKCVNLSSRVSSSLPGWGFVSLNSCNRARRGYTAWAHPIFLLPFPLFSMPYMRSSSVNCDDWTRVGKIHLMASRRVGYLVVVSWPSVFIVNESPPSNRIVTSFSSADTSMVCARFHSFWCCMWARCWVFIIACAKPILAAEVIQFRLYGSQFTLIPSVLVRWHANQKEF